MLRFWLVLAVTLGLAGAVAEARPGGGSTYSGGGGGGSYSSSRSSSSSYSSSSSGGGGSGEAIGIVFLVIIVVILFGAGASKTESWNSAAPATLRRAVSLAPLRERDPDFSPPLFEDFAFRLFATAQRARHSEATRATIAPYVAAAARAHLAARALTGEPAAAVVVGALRVVALHLSLGDGDDDRLTVEFEANVMVAAGTQLSVEAWTFARSPHARTKPPDPSRRFPCPSCGAPWQANQTGTQQCASCGQIVDNGRFDWLVTAIELRSMQHLMPTLTSEVPERGTDLPTVFSPRTDAAWAALKASDPAVTGDSLRARLALIYSQLNDAWSTNDLASVRGLVTDGLYDTLDYWVQAYRRQGLQNRLQDMRILRSDLVKVVSDRWVHAVTVRLFATGKDYVIRSDTGERVRGSAQTERRYSEYWTLIRSTARTGAPVATRACSNCGGPLKVSQAGACEYCNAHVTLGEFDWVLSKIEQDDSYAG